MGYKGESYTVKYKGTPLEVRMYYSTGKFVIYDKERKEWGAEYSGFDRAHKHAQDWNKIVKRHNAQFK